MFEIVTYPLITEYVYSSKSLSIIINKDKPFILKIQKEGFNKELICYLSPYMTAHVNRFGKYHIDSNREPEKLPFDLSLFSKDMVFP